MSKKPRRATTWELSVAPKKRARYMLEEARTCGNPVRAARAALSAANYAVNARSRGQVIDADHVDPEDMLVIKNNALDATQAALNTCRAAWGQLVVFRDRCRDERNAALPIAREARRLREAREKLTARGSRGPYASICGTYRACKS